MELFSRIVRARRYVGLWKTRTLPEVIDSCTMLTRDPSYPANWKVLLAMMEVLLNIEAGQPQNERQVSQLINILSPVLDYMANDSPQKGIIHGACNMAEDAKRADRQSEETGP